MTREKELGYELGNIIWNNLDGYQELWRIADFDTKEKIVNGLGELAFKSVQFDRKFLRDLVDIVWNHITESEEVPSTMTADKLIDKAIEYSNNSGE